MIIKSPMYCVGCDEIVKVKMTKEFISLKCGCSCIIYYPSGEISVVPFEEYDKNYGGVNNG